MQSLYALCLVAAAKVDYADLPFPAIREDIAKTRRLAVCLRIRWRKYCKDVVIDSATLRIGGMVYYMYHCSNPGLVIHYSEPRGIEYKTNNLYYSCKCHPRAGQFSPRRWVMSHSVPSKGLLPERVFTGCPA